MSESRPITRAIALVRQVADEIELSHTIDGHWPIDEIDARMECLRLRGLADLAQREFGDLRQKELRLSQIENMEAM